ncbi:UNVERIFIED_CONTAM: hypothetical protein PYX00_008899 [Menopon gallinae]|uniref:Ubiquitin-like protease family profile domain-containing protein n=1 Tax=Menopon gallinae TaxID=328185 RepID=A0AAW2H980_9NEOP
MAQYYQLTSLEEICHLYPNLQVDNIDSVQYMVQDDKIIQYTDAQGQQVLTAIDNSNIQFGQGAPLQQQGVLVIEAIDPQSLEANQAAVSSKQPQVVVQQINSAGQPSNQISGTQQPLILQHVDQGSAESDLSKGVSCGDKPQSTMPVDPNKSQTMNQQSQYVIQPIQANVVHVDSKKEPETFTVQNVENTHFVMQKVEGIKKQQTQYQTQHFIVPQGEKLQPKLVVHRLEMPKTMSSTPQLIVQQFQPATSTQGSQYVVQQLDLSDSVQKLDSGKKEGKSPQCIERRIVFKEKGEENALGQFTNDAVCSKKVDDATNRQDGVIEPIKSQLTEDTTVTRISQHIQTSEMNEKQINVQQARNEPQRLFIQQSIGTQLNHIQRSPQQGVQHSQNYTKARIAENYSNTDVSNEQSKTGDTSEQHSHLQVPSQQICCIVQEEKRDDDNSLKNKPESSPLEYDQNGFRIVSSLSSVSSASLQQSKRITVKHNEMESYPASVFLIPKGDNQTYQAAQTVPQLVNKQIGTNDKTSQTGDISHDIVLQLESPIITTAAPEDTQKTANVTGLSQRKITGRCQVIQGATVSAPAESGEKVTVSRLQPSPTNKTVSSVITAGEQIKEWVSVDNEKRDVIVQPCSYNNVTTQSVATQSTSVTPINVRVGKGAVRGGRGGLHVPVQRGIFQCSPVVRGVQIQTASRHSQPEAERKVKDCKTVNAAGTLGSVSGVQEIRHQSVPRPIIYQLASVGTNSFTDRNNSDNNINSNNSGSGTSGVSNNNVINTSGGTSNNSSNNPNTSDLSQGTENMDETRMLVLLPNGERRLVRFPNSQQNVHFNQLWQQVRFSLGSQISIVSNDRLGEKTGCGHVLIKVENKDKLNSHDSAYSGPIVTGASAIQNSSTCTAPLQSKPRGVSPRLITTSTSIRSRVTSVTPRLGPPRMFSQRIVTPTLQSQNILTQNNSLQTTGTQSSPETTQLVQHQKEAPKFIAGQVAICPFCGISSLDFNKCIRCRRKLPPNVKSQSIPPVKKTSEKGNTSNEEVADCSNAEEEEEDKCTETQGIGNKEKITSPISDKKKAKPSVKKKKIPEEPAEIFILSSDDEEESAVNKSDVTRELPVLEKEPVYGIMHLSAEEIAAASKGSNLVDDLMENVQPGLYTTLQCRSVRIGSYKTQPKERVFLSTKGVRFVVPSLKNEIVTILIPSAEILKILVHFGKQMSIVFIYASPKMGFRIRSQLGMESKLGPYYDPTASQDETHKRLSFFMEKMTDDNKIAIHTMFAHSELIEELSEKEANEILLRASPMDEHGALARPVDTVRKIMIYPPPPEKGGIALNNQDYACLGEDQFLNDVIIDFYLKYLLYKVLSAEDRERTHVFSTFFYKRLTTKPKTMGKNDPENDPKLSPAEKRHMRVKGWTKHVNLFEKDFIIVPINEHSHWFLAIICFPGLTGPVRFSDNSPVEPEEVQPKKTSRTVQIGNTTITHIIKTEKSSVTVEMGPGSDRDEAEGDQDDLHPSSDEEESEQTEEETASNSTQVEIPLLSPAPQSFPEQSKDPKARCLRRKNFKEPIKQPCILIFDSLAGASRVRVVATLRDYLKIEYKKKMGRDREFSKDTIKGAVPKVPQQNNFTDCGLYVLQYVESFFQDPLHDFKLPLKYLQDWFPEEVVSGKRQELACLIRSLMEEQGIKVDEMGLPTLTFTNSSNTGEEQAKLEEEEEEEEEEMEEDELNGEEEELEKNATAECDFDIDEAEDMDLDDDEQEEGDDEEEEEEEEDEEDEELYDELKLNELQRFQVTVRGPEKGGEDCPIPSNAMGCVTSESGEDHCSRNVQTNVCSSERIKCLPIHENVNETDNGEEKSVKYRKVNVQLNRRSVPLTEYQDFESQISCTTIEKNAGGELDMVISDGEDEGKIEVMDMENAIVMSNSSGASAGNAIGSVANEKNSLEVANNVVKLVNEKGVTVQLREDVSGLVDACSKRLNENCDTKLDDCSEHSESDIQKTNSPCSKRSYEALKSVRIPRKAERAIDFNKRQRIDET